MRRPRLQVVAPLPSTSMLPAASFSAAATHGAAYQIGSVNRCPHCGGTAFHVGRATAECGACGNPLPIAPDRRVLTAST